MADAASFAVLVPRHTAAMLHVAASLVGMDDAEDAAQEAIMRAKPNRQRDLFEKQRATTRVPTTLKATLVRRIGVLLIEAIGSASVKARPCENTASETGHEQDHS